MTHIRVGARGSDVEKWQLFLLGQHLDVGPVDGDFGPRTDTATREFQRQHRLQVDGVVGNQTIGQAMVLGFEVVASPAPSSDEISPNFPPRPDFAPLSSQARSELFGHFDFVPKPRPGFPEGIEITGGWEQANIVSVEIPELAGVHGAPSSRTVRFHRLAAPRLQALFAAWAEADLSQRLRSWDGSFVPRFIRGSTSILSNHAWGTAFDVNAAYNPLGVRPALVGQPGSVRELVGIANELGFYWGGHFAGRPDGMHFECAKLG